VIFILDHVTITSDRRKQMAAEDKSSPLPKAMYGFISETGEPSYIAYDIEFRDVHAIGERKLQGMLKAFKRVKAKVEKDEAREPGDKFMALASALKLSFAVERIKRNGNSDDWRWMSVSEGRNRYRALIEEAVAAAVARKVA
jgi:hypothetical protein